MDASSTMSAAATKRRLLLKIVRKPAEDVEREPTQGLAKDEDDGDAVVDAATTKKAGESESVAAVDDDDDDDDDDNNNNNNDNNDAAADAASSSTSRSSSVETTADPALADLFYAPSQQGTRNPVLLNATNATPADWEDFFRLAASAGNKEIVAMVKAADPTSALNVKRVVNMVFKGQGRLAKIRGLSLSRVRKAFQVARESNGVRRRQREIRARTLAAGRVSRAQARARAASALVDDAMVVDDEEAEAETEAGAEDAADVAEEERREIEAAARILVQISMDAWNSVEDESTDDEQSSQWS